MTEAQTRAAADFVAARGGPVFGPFVPLLYSPELLASARAMGDYLRFRSALPPRLSELAILIVARHWTQQFEWSVHAPLAVNAGIAAGAVEAIAQGQRPVQLDADQAVLFDFCRELLDTRTVGDAAYARARNAFGEQGVVDLLGMMGYYTLLAMVLNTAGAPLPNAQPPGLLPFPR